MSQVFQDVLDKYIIYIIDKEYAMISML